MQRRAYLGGIASLGTVGVVGCSGFGDPNPNVTLPEPDRPFDSADVPYPAWGERIPDVTVPAPLENRLVTLPDIDKPALLTFFYSYCQTVCPILIATMQNVQTHALNNGYGESVGFFPTTFDPERDDANRLTAYANERNIALEAGNWHFLRPKSRRRAKAVVTEEFGVAFQRTHPEDMNRYMFTHTPMTILVNADGFVERAYRTKTPDVDQLIHDLATVRNA